MTSSSSECCAARKSDSILLIFYRRRMLRKSLEKTQNGKSVTWSRQFFNLSCDDLRFCTSLSSDFSTMSCTLSIPCRFSRKYKHSSAIFSGASRSSSALVVRRFISASNEYSATHFSSSMVNSFRQNVKSVRRSPNLRPASRCPWAVTSSVCRINRMASLRKRSEWFRLMSDSAYDVRHEVCHSDGVYRV